MWHGNRIVLGRSLYILRVRQGDPWFFFLSKIEQFIYGIPCKSFVHRRIMSLCKSHISTNVCVIGNISIIHRYKLLDLRRMHCRIFDEYWPMSDAKKGNTDVSPMQELQPIVFQASVESRSMCYGLVNNKKHQWKRLKIATTCYDAPIISPMPKRAPQHYSMPCRHLLILPKKSKEYRCVICCFMWLWLWYSFFLA